MNLLIAIFTFVLILVSLFLVLLVLMQKAKNDGGMGAALGGGATEATFGADTGSVLTKATINSAIAFFLLSLLLYLGHIHVRNNAAAEAAAILPIIDTPPATSDSIFAPATRENADASPAVVTPDLEIEAASEDASEPQS